MTKPAHDPSVGGNPIFGLYHGKIEIVGDILAPLYSDEELEEFFARSCAKLYDKSDD